jgi:hypothetical protein
METIKSEKTGKAVKLELIDPNSGCDFFADVIGGTNTRVPEDDEHDAYWSVADDDELDWWVGWTSREQAIIDAREGADDETIAEDERLIADYGYDYDLLQEKELALFGIED